MRCPAEYTGNALLMSSYYINFLTETRQTSMLFGWKQNSLSGANAIFLVLYICLKVTVVGVTSERAYIIENPDQSDQRLTFACRLYIIKASLKLTTNVWPNLAGFGGSIGCAVRLETRRPGSTPDTFFRDREIFSTVILSLPLFQEGQLSVSGEKMCTILVNRLED